MASAAGDLKVVDEGEVLMKYLILKLMNDQRFGEDWPKEFQLHWPGEDYAYKFEKVKIIGLFVYICKKGNDWGRDGEGFVLFREEGTWTAWNGDFTANGEMLLCRQKVFRCHQDITKPGEYVLQINWCANRYNERGIVNWGGSVLVRTTEPQDDA